MAQCWINTFALSLVDFTILSIVSPILAGFTNNLPRKHCQIFKNTRLPILQTDMTCIGQYHTVEVSFWCQQTLHTSLFIRMPTLQFHCYTAYIIVPPCTMEGGILCHHSVFFYHVKLAESIHLDWTNPLVCLPHISFKIKMVHIKIASNSVLPCTA